ncbi:MAG: carboxypeptidase-like regulatory domain-containing protein [Chitinophagales bacterium]
MKTSIFSTVKAIITLSIFSLFAFAIPANAAINGTWENEDPNTRSITKIIVTGGNTIQLFGSCSPTDCDWGTTALQYRSNTRIGKQYTASYDQGFAKRTLTVYEQPSGKLYLQMASTYTDGRPAQKSSEYFVRKTCGGFQGMVAEKDNYSNKIAGVAIQFTSEDGSLSQTVTSTNSGTYKIELPQGRYKVTTTHRNYETYTTGQGFFVVTCQGIQTGNIFMEKKPAPQPTLKEDCVSFNPKNLSVKPSGNQFLLVDGSHSLKAFPTKAEAYQAMKIIQYYGINQSCFVGRPNPSFTYLLVNGKAPSGNVSGDDCTSFNPNTIELKEINGSWKIVDGSHWMFDFGGNYAEAKQAFLIIKKYGFTQSCFVGRPNPSLQYLIK